MTFDQDDTAGYLVEHGYLDANVCVYRELWKSNRHSRRTECGNVIK